MSRVPTAASQPPGVQPPGDEAMGDPELWESCTLLGSPRPRSAGSHCPPCSLGGRQAPTPQASLLVNTATSGSKGLQSPSSSPSKEGKMQARRQCEGESPQYRWAPSGSQVQTCPAVPCPLGPARQPPHPRNIPDQLLQSCHQRETCRCLICFKGKKYIYKKMANFI